MFLTIGVFIAVFGMRFALPLIIVAYVAGLTYIQTGSLALNDPNQYAAILTSAGPLIYTFGFTFLGLIGLNRFMNVEIEQDDDGNDMPVIYWLKWLERPLHAAGRSEHVPYFIMIVLSLILAVTVESSEAIQVLAASIVAVAVHLGLSILGTILTEPEATDGIKNKVAGLSGLAALGQFIYLEFLDASFSLDGVIGAFAITVLLVPIVVGLGNGAMFVRSLTVLIVRKGALKSLPFLDHGAHWAILALAAVMAAKLFHLELNEVATGLIGIVIIGAAFAHSVRRAKQNERLGLA